jgi:restriction system protein
MAEITRKRTGQLLQVVFSMLVDKPEGLPAKEILVEIPGRLTLTEYETGYYPSSLTAQRYEKIIRFATITRRKGRPECI